MVVFESNAQNFNGKTIADSQGKIDLNILGENCKVSSDFMVISDHLRVKTTSISGQVTIIAEPVSVQQGQCECADSECAKLIDEIYTQNQSKSDSVDKFMRIFATHKPKYVKLKAEGLSEGDIVYYEIAFIYK